MKRYAVIFSKYARFTWTDREIRRGRSKEGAIRLATRIGDKHPDLRVTRYTYHKKRSAVEVRDRKTGKLVWEHPGVIVPSVGELGWTP